MCRLFCRVNKEFARSQATKAWVVVFQQTSWKYTVTGNQCPWGGGLLAGCLLIGIIPQRIIVCGTHADWTHNIFPSCKWSMTVLMNLKFGVWINPTKERRNAFHWKIHAEEQSCALGQLPRMETQEHTEKGHWWVLSHFLFFPLVLIKRLEEDQPCQNKTERTGLFCTGQGCPNQGLLDLWGNCRFIEISAWVQMWVRPCCQTTAKVRQICPANQQVPGLGAVCEGWK